jgi:uncharacterized protein
MIKQTTLKELVEQQLQNLRTANPGQFRHLLVQLRLDLPQHALIISGIRRCGKSTLLHQLIETVSESYFYLNFDSAKL